MQKIFEMIFDFIFPRRENDAIIYHISPQDFYKRIPRWESGVYPDMLAIFHYKDPMAKAMVKELKSSKNEHAAAIAAYALANFFEENGIHDAIIVPMPISKKRRKKRGYNQCEFLAEAFVQEIFERKNGAHFEIRYDILEKIIDTPKLALENRAARLKANEGVFRARCTLGHIQRRIIVVDDVITTGSTMHSAMETLRSVGAKNVSGIGIAH